MSRTAHYVASTHWDREWYESFQGFRMRLVSLLDEVLDTMSRDPEFRVFVMDGQVIPIWDYLEVRPEREEEIRRRVAEGRLRVGPWYVLPDEWLVCGESLVRNLETGMKMARELGHPSSRAGFACDQFGHVGQLPQIFDQFGIPSAFVWRGTNEREHGGHFLWRAPDGSGIPTYRFGSGGYCSYVFRVRNPFDDGPFDPDEAAKRLADYVHHEAGRSPVLPILLFDGGDHMEIEPRTSALIGRANARLEADGIRIVHSDLDAYMEDLKKDTARIRKTITGELRETGRDPASEDQQWLIPGVLSSRIHLKGRNAACEDELCLWAEPFSAFAAQLGEEYPEGYLRVAWRHLLENHPHDSICGCSIDPVHQDMIYRFDQSLGISSRLTDRALRAIAAAATPSRRDEGAIALTIFNATADDLDEPVDLDIPLPTNWPKRYQEFFGFEEKFAFRLRTDSGKEVPYQLVGQTRDRKGFHRPRYKFPRARTRHIIHATARVRVPACGYTTLTVEPANGPTRYPGSMAASHDTIDNGILRARANPNGTLSLTDRRSGRTFDGLLTFEQRADIGDGWYHGVAVNDQVFLSSTCPADLAWVADGIGKATLRISVTMQVPEAFDFAAMTRSDRTAPLRIVSEVTLRAGSDALEVTTAIHNTVLDHRVRVLLPTGLKGDTYLSDSAFDVVERPVALAPDNAIRRELDVETRPQITWTAFGDGVSGLAVVSRGIPESAVVDTLDRPIALTLLRAFRRAVFANDNPGGQMQGTQTFRYDIVPFSGGAPRRRLFLLGQRVNGPVRVVDLPTEDPERGTGAGSLPPDHSFLESNGNAVITSIRRDPTTGELAVRLFSPHDMPERATVRFPRGPQSARCVTLDGRDDDRTTVEIAGNQVNLLLPPKRIATLLLR